ncbi:MAG: gliding motility-associated C-terminal domain-containing protein [Bacteroidetes bacterium]|nr:gliding motility-associated C-terminal domain-containing protein [Bacteroidota bacterium]
MNRIKRGLIWIVLLGTAGMAQATHLVGGFLSYRYTGQSAQNTSYRVNLYVYRDCSNDGDPNKKIPFDQTITLCVYKASDNSLLRSFSVNLRSESSVDPVGNTDCPELANACLKRGIYEANISVPNSSTGYKLKWERCCRNTQTNLEDNGGDPYQGQTYYGFIPATALKNSSPYFQDVPVPFICANDTTTVRNRAVDPDGDSLSYKFVTPWQGASVADPIPDNCVSKLPSSFRNVDYISGFDYTRPFGNGGISKIDNFNGLTTYLAPSSGRYAVAIEVTEWRNGIPISTIRLDLQILVINCKPNNKPRLSYQGGTKVWYVEAGAKICKDVSIIDDKDLNDNVTIKGYGDMLTGANGFTGTKATMSPAPAVGKRTATTKFCWDTDCEHASSEPYVLTFEGYDDGCPSKFVNENVLIYVTPFVPAELPQGPVTVCQNSTATYSLKNMNSSNSYRWRVNGGKIIGDSTKSTVTVQWGTSTSGTVSVFIISQYGCEVGPRDLKVTLIAAPPKPIISGKDTVCLNTMQTYTGAAVSGVTYSWKATGGSILGSNTGSSVNINWNTQGNGFVVLTVTNSNGCVSEPDTFRVFVSHPNTPPITGPNSVCPNNSGIEYYIDPDQKGSVYRWFITGGAQASGALTSKITVDWFGKGTGAVKVLEVNRFGCIGDTVRMAVKIDHNLNGQLPQGDTSICEFTKGVVYKIISVKGETYTWIVTGGTIVSGQGTATIVVDWGATGTGSIGVQSTAMDPVTNQPCISPVRARIVNIRPVPGKTNILGDFERCQIFGFGSYVINGFSGSSYEWELNGLQFTGQGTNNISVNLDAFGSFPVRVREITQYGCPGPWNDTVLILHPRPVTTPIDGKDIICNPNLTGYNYTVTGFNTSTFNWWLDGGNITAGNGTPGISVNWNNQQNSKVFVIETSDFGCVGDTIKRDIFIDDPKITCRLVSVNPPPGKDADILVYYNLSNAPRYDKEVYIQRRLRGSSGNFVTVGNADPAGILHVDQTALPDSNSYEYRAVAVNLCGDSIYSNQNTDILLKYVKTGPFSYDLTFTDYLTWPNGVARYELYRALEEKSDYELFGSYPAPTTDQFDNGREHFGMWYRIKAIENGGENRESWSNDVKIYFEPLIYIPNAFTPDINGLNDNFNPTSGGLKTYEMRIYNRWGEKLYDTENVEIGWDGMYNGSPAPMGIYVYVIDYTDYRNKQYQVKGTLHLLR